MALTEKGKKVLEVLKSHDASKDAPLSSKDVAAAAFMTPRSVPGVLTSLVNKGLVGKTEDSPRLFFLTDEGRNYKDED